MSAPEQSSVDTDLTGLLPGEVAPSPTGLVQPDQLFEIVEEQADEDRYQRKTLGVGFWLAVAWLFFMLICTFFAQWIPGLPGPEERVGSPRLGPSGEHWFGTSNRGFSVLSRTIHGTRISLGIALLSTIGGLIMGGTLGLLAGFYRRGIDNAVTSIVNIMLAVPGLVLALALVGFFAPIGGFEAQRFLFFEVSPETNAAIWTTIALAILATPSIARVARAQTMVWSDREFVLASRTIGTRNMRIIIRDVLPNVLPPMASFALIGIAALIVAQAALAFFGVGDVTAVSWGADINFGRDRLDSEPHLVLFPSLFMFLTVLALNYLADKFTEFSAIRDSGL